MINDIGQAICDKLNEHSEKLAVYLPKKEKTGCFTKEVINILRSLGEDAGYLVCPSGGTNPEDCGEWLYDMVWYKDIEEQNGDRFILPTSVDLVLEMEISGTKWGKFKEDFDKLLIAKNSCRVMIFTENDNIDSVKAKRYAQKALNSFTGLDIGDEVTLIFVHESGEGDFFMKKYRKGLMEI